MTTRAAAKKVHLFNISPAPGSLQHVRTFCHSLFPSFNESTAKTSWKRSRVWFRRHLRSWAQRTKVKIRSWPKARLRGWTNPHNKVDPQARFLQPVRCPLAMSPLSLVNQGKPFRNTMEYAAVNVDRLQHWVDQGRLVSTSEQPITARELLLSGCVHDVKDGIKILGDVRLFFERVNSVTQAP